MVNEIQYTSIKRVLDSLLDHPMLRDLSLEQAVRYTLRFIELHGYNKLYQDKNAVLDIHEYRAMMPCDLVRILQVKDCKTGICMRSMTDTFMPGSHRDDSYSGIPRELTFKTQGRVLFTSFPEGQVSVAYKAIPVDEDGFPLLIDNEVYLGALEAYIKKQVFIIKFDQGKIAAGVLQNAKQDYAVLAKQVQSEFTMPSVSEMQSISNMMTHLIPRMHQFYNGFRTLGEKEVIYTHDNRG